MKKLSKYIIIFVVLVINMASANSMVQKNPTVSQKTNFTLVSINPTQKVILELWTDKVLSPMSQEQMQEGDLQNEEPDNSIHGHSNNLHKKIATVADYRLNGNLYVLDQNLFGQTRIGKLKYSIDLGFHDVNTEKKYNTSYGEVLKSDRDWITLEYRLKDKYSQGTWKCIDGFSNYTLQPRYDLDDHYPNVQDKTQNCKIVQSSVNQKIVNKKRINLKVQFNRLFNSGENSQDILLTPGEKIAIQIRLEDELSPNQKSYQSWSDFYYTIPMLDFGSELDANSHSDASTEINIIILALICGSWGIILTCRHLENKQNEAARAKLNDQIKQSEPKRKNYD